MTNYRRNFVTGSSFFFTVNLADRQSCLLTETSIYCARHFAIQGRSIPSRLKPLLFCLNICTPSGHYRREDLDYAARWRLIKTPFSRGLPKGERISPGRQNKGERGIWQRRYWEHTLRDERDFERHVDYIHFNPVKHGHVKSVVEWPYSSFQRFVEMGSYAADWGVEGEDAPCFGER